MKRLFPLFLAALMLIASVSAGAIANPIREVYDDDEFEDVLNIEIDDDELFATKPQMSIISNEIGQIKFNTDDPEGKPVEWTLRFTRKQELDGKIEEFAGLYATDWVTADPFEYTYTEKDDKDKDDTVTVTVNSASSESLNASVFFWNHRGVCYSLSVVGDYSQMLFAEIFDSVMACCFD